MIRANTAEIIITPPIGTTMLEPPGVPTTGSHDELCCRAIVFDDGKQRVAIVTLDLLGMDAPMIQRTQRAIWEQTHIPATNVMLTATHNHSAPVTLDCGQDEYRNRAWENDLVQKIVDCVTQASQNLQPISLAIGREPVQIGVNRRISIMGRTRMLANDHAPILPHVDVLRVDTTDGKTMAVLFNHAAHPVTVHTASTQFNADYPGATVRYIRQALGKDVMPLFTQGCAGDINVVSLAGGLDEAHRLGNMLGEAVVNTLTNMQTLDVETITVVNRETLLPFEAIPSSTLDKLEDRIRESTQALTEHDEDPRTHHDQQMLMRWLKRVRHAPPGLRFRVQGIAFDNQLVILGMTHELFAAYQIAIEARSPFKHTLTCGYTNGCNGYIPTAEAFYLGGYEVEGAPKLFGLPRLHPTSEALVHATVDEALHALYH